MKQYIVYYIDNSTEVVEAYNCNFKMGRAVFDLGRGRERICTGVKWVDFA